MVAANAVCSYGNVYGKCISKTRAVALCGDCEGGSGAWANPAHPSASKACEHQFKWSALAEMNQQTVITPRQIE
jgi:hypothetical protein